MDKVQENRLRRMANRQGYVLSKTRRRDPDAIDFGLYALIDPESGGTIHAQGPISPYALTLEDVAEWLEGDEAD